MSDDALADLVEAFGHVTEAEMQSFLDDVPASTRPVAVIDEAALAIVVPADAPAPAHAA